MNNDIRSEISKYNLPINKLTIKSGARIIDDKIVVKDKKNKEINKTYKYLSSRAFDYFPYLIDDSDKYCERLYKDPFKKLDDESLWR